ncbi:MAG TPA: TetR/AcrR family transcriptional regulator [Coriobacteriia bacterium]|nr:TetR/AcrR family transcriptional regulator [Coriobacteriia bacterium]
METREAEAGSARERILTIAGDLFAEHGYDAVSIADLASAAGISTGLIYYHFKDKETLYGTVVREGVHLLEETAVATLVGDRSPTDRLRLFVVSYMRLLEGKTSLMRLLIRSVSDVAGPAPRHALMRSAAIIDRLHAVIEEGVAAGEFRAVDTHLAATALFALINTLITARVLDTPLGGRSGGDIEQQASFMVELFLEGVGSCS